MRAGKQPPPGLEIGLWCLAWAASPFYLMREGLPQLFDILLFALLLVLLVRRRLMVSELASQALGPLLTFTLYAALVSSFWAVCFAEPRFFAAPTYYFFNLLLVLVATSLHERWGETFLRATLKVWIASIAVQAVLPLALTADPETPRADLFFNNANQVAIYAVCGGVVVAQCAPLVRLRPVVEHTVYGLCAFLVLLSASRAGAIACVTLLAVRYFTRPLAFFAFTIVSVALLQFLPWESIAFGFLSDRVQRAVDSSAAALMSERGYARVLENPHHLLLGAGEGAESRFGETIELHSTPGTLLFSYGIIGAALFVVAILQPFRLRRGGFAVRPFLLLVPVFVFGLFHHTLRMRFFWLCFALTLVVVRHYRARAASHEAR
jgi:hypothetical protein